MSFQISDTCFKEAFTPTPVITNTEKLHLELKNQLSSANKVSVLLGQGLNLLNIGIEETQHILADTNNKFVRLDQAIVDTKQCLDNTQQSLTTTNEKLLVFNQNLSLTNREIEDLKESNSELIAMLKANDRDAAQLRADNIDDARSFARLEAQTRRMINVMNQLVVLQQQNI